MTKENKDKFIFGTMSSAIGGIIVGIFMFIFTTGDLDAREFKKELSNKADKSQLKEFEAANIREHDQLKEELKGKASKETVLLMWDDIKTIKTIMLEDKKGN